MARQDTMEKDYGHRPVLLHECMEALAIRPEGVYVDGTLGRGGHSLAIAQRLTTGRLIALDRDETALAAAEALLPARPPALVSAFTSAPLPALPAILSSAAPTGTA